MHLSSFQYSNQHFFYGLRDDTDQAVFHEIFIRQDYKIAHQAIKQAKSPIIDVGAHVGFFSLLCYCLNKNVSIYAIEPEPNNYAMLEMHIAKNKISTITPVKGALASTDGQKVLECNVESIRHKVVEKKQELKVQKSHHKVRGYLPVTCFSLNTLMHTYSIDRIGLLKMDIEGGEYDILLNMKEEIRPCIDVLILEYHTNRQYKHANPETLLALMRSKGFAVQHFPSKYEKTLGFLFGRNKKQKSQ